MEQKIHRRKFITVRVSRAEKDIIEENAKNKEVDVSTFVRELALQGKIPEAG